MRNLLPIGRFSEICRLSIPALRHYDELGLLPPAAVDPDTGYRYYSISQAEDAERIRTLRFLEMPLPEIRALLAGDAVRTKALLETHRQRLVEEADKQRYAITLLETMLREEPPMQYEIHLRETVTQTAAAVRGRTCWADLEPFIAGAVKELFRVTGDQCLRPAGPMYGIYHVGELAEAELELEIGVPVSAPVEPRGRIVATTILGGLVAATVHAGRYEDVAPAYRALGEWVQEHGHETAGTPREVYIVGPEQVAEPGALRTEILWPIR
ncbi:MAG TPA: MerR family transcriptional regulator [Candidatus Limnocylindrales bacterium]